MRSTHAIPAGRAIVAAECVGRGEPVVFLHAGVADRRMWDAQLVELGTHCRAIAYDRRGFGQTQRVDERYSETDDLWAVLDHFAGNEPALLVGCSMGGRIAIDSTLLDPERVRALVLIAPAVSGAPDGDVPPQIAQKVAELEAAESAGQLERVNALEAEFWLDGPLAAPGRVGGAVRELFLAMNAVALGSPALGQALEPREAWSRLEDVTVPTLVVCGELDFPYLRERCGQIAARIAGARLVRMTNAAHLPSMDCAAECSAIIRTFIGALQSEDR